MIRKQAALLIIPLLLWLPGCATHRTVSTPATAEPIVSPLAKATMSWNGATLPEYPKGQPEITLLEITIPPGARLPLHRHPFINAGVVLSGELTVVTTTGRTLQLKAGDAIVEVVDTLHYGMNAGTIPARLILFYAGVEGSPISVTERGSETSGVE